ncbi:hypothetical protein F8388_026104 [Cannabis sativa]|uniref:Peptide N-acetyl-beta-D-glucosaminyl asparaginase amidase A N-terminal domain-containing protein n=1 Tax=Cannabis sativa TaxID=3483 RepID=A0A7J6FZY1_CANSA|nr:hypothetical protein F8388_026104 [Cannabis sativa]KAF4397777.1 hypothetical protein G4B88_017258 [Cannabis sativa]
MPWFRRCSLQDGKFEGKEGEEDEAEVGEAAVALGNFPLNDGLWFEIKNSMNTELKEFKIPQNSYRAVLEVYVSFHENDEFWYSNLPNDYIAVNELSDTLRNALRGT